MVNLMYLVLTAMLALNVSAEVMQALFFMDKSLNESSQLVEVSNEKLAIAINKQADAYSQYEPFKEKVKKMQETANEFFNYINELRAEIIEAAGGLDKNGLPKQKDNKDISQRILLKNGRAEVLKGKIIETREQLLALVDNKAIRQEIGNNIPLKINPIPEDSDKRTWEQFTFQQMPVAAVLPILSKFQNDAKLTETTILNHFFNQMNIDVVRPDKFYPVISTNNNYVIRGEKYEGEIFLAAYSSTADNLSISVDGRPLRVEDGKAVFATNPNSIGSRQHKMSIKMTNPITGEEEIFSRKFGYEVGDRSVAVSLNKMNVMYIGVENPISISAAGISTTDMNVSANGINLTKKSSGEYIAIPERKGEATITVSGGSLDPTTLKYKIKKIPNPTMKLGNNTGGSIRLAEFKAQQGLIPILENFDFDAKCSVDGFEITRVRNGDAATAKNRKARFGSETRRLIDKAALKDIFYFNNIKVRCPGDDAGRKMPEMFFNIK
ncbi:MAG: gliding motility-associated protein GldM [Saprospiraceae bacterium]|jgi:gliding motility-associated protein GldM